MSDGSLGTNLVCQVGLIVRDIEQARQAYAEFFGVPVPEIIISGPLEETNVRYHGKPTEGRAKLAFFKAGQIDIELIEPIGGPSTWQEFLDDHGEGMHHIAFSVKGMDGIIAGLESKGMPLVQRGDFPSGRCAYIDATGQLKLILELLESKS